MSIHRVAISCLLLLLVGALTNSPVMARASLAPTATPPPSGPGIDSPTANISAWHVSAALNQPRYRHAMTAWQNVLYVLGGINASRCQGDIEYAVIQKDGVLTGWSPASLPPAQTSAGLDLVRCSFEAVTADNHLYLLGGTNEQNGLLASVTMASIQPWGDLSAWQAARPLPEPRANFGAAATNGYVYIAGGFNSANSAPLNSVLYARILPDGSLDAWNTTESLRARGGLELLAVGGSLYAIGGYDPAGSVSSTVQYAQIRADGSLSAWKTTNALNTPRAYFGAASDGQYLYVMGGADQTPTNVSNSVEFAQIAPDHSLSRWRTTRNNLLQAKTDLSAAAVNGYLYVTGGMAYDNSFHTTEYAQAIGKGPALAATALPSPTPTATLPPSPTSTITLTPTVTSTSTPTATFDPFLVYTQAAQTIEAALAQTAQAATRTPTPSNTPSPAPTDTLTVSPTETTAPADTDTPAPPPTLTATQRPTVVAGEQIRKFSRDYGGWAIAVTLFAVIIISVGWKMRGRKLVINWGGDPHRPQTNKDQEKNG